jgi:hypothetical protein
MLAVNLFHPNGGVTLGVTHHRLAGFGTGGSPMPPRRG